LKSQSRKLLPDDSQGEKANANLKMLEEYLMS